MIACYHCIFAVPFAGLGWKRPEHQPPESWRAVIKRRLLPPTIALQLQWWGSGCGQPDSKSDITGDYSVDAVLQVHNDAPVELLLGTDLQPHLGFTFMQLNGSQPPLDLLQMQEKTPEGTGLAPTRRYRLLVAGDSSAGPSLQTRPCSGQGGPWKPDPLFEPNKHLSAQGVTMTDGAVSPGLDRSLTLIVENEGFPVWLQVGQVLGKLEHANLVEWPDTP